MSIQSREQLLSLDGRQSRGGPSEAVSQQCKNVQEVVGAKACGCEAALASPEWGRLHAGALAGGGLCRQAHWKEPRLWRGPLQGA